MRIKDMCKSFSVKIYSDSIPNTNGFFYTRESLENAVKEANERIKPLTVHLEEYGESDKVDVTTIIAEAKLEIRDDGFVIAHIDLVNTPLSYYAESLISELNNCGILPTSIGTLNGTNINKFEVTKLTLVSLDVVKVSEEVLNAGMFRIHEHHLINEY